MKTKTRSIQQIIEDQVKSWRLQSVETKVEKVIRPVITISREPGSGGRILAELLAKRFKLDLFHQKVLNKMAASAQVSESVLETLDERGLSILEDWISSIVEDRHLWPDQYLQHLMKVIGTIGKHGRAVIVGRGANFIIPPEGQLRMRVVAPLEMRIQNVAQTYNVSHENAKRRIIRTESDRRAFIRKYFNADIADPINYDLVINSACLDLENITDAIGMMMNLQKPG